MGVTPLPPSVRAQLNAGDRVGFPIRFYKKQLTFALSLALSLVRPPRHTLKERHGRMGKGVGIHSNREFRSSSLRNVCCLSLLLCVGATRVVFYAWMGLA